MRKKARERPDRRAIIYSSIFRIEVVNSSSVVQVLGSWIYIYIYIVFVCLSYGTSFKNNFPLMEGNYEAKTIYPHYWYYFCYKQNNLVLICFCIFLLNCAVDNWNHAKNSMPTASVLIFFLKSRHSWYGRWWFNFKWILTFLL